MARSARKNAGTETVGGAAATLSSTVQDTGEQRYRINFASFVASGRSAPFVLAGRLCGRCEPCLKFTKENPAYLRSAEELLKQIANSCSREPAYLLPGTPVTEAVFRLMLASGNRPMTVAEIQGGLTQAWASVIYLKNLSDDVVRRMLEQPNEYHIEAHHP